MIEFELRSFKHCSNSWIFSRFLIDSRISPCFLYLDSFDLIAEDPHPSQQHHLKELCAVNKNLREGSLVVVDDHFTGLGIGKGMYVKDFMADIGAELLFEEYQIGWRI